MLRQYRAIEESRSSHLALRRAGSLPCQLAGPTFDGMRGSVTPGMVVKAGGGGRLGHVASVSDEGFQIADGPMVKWDEIIEVKDDEVHVAVHRPALDERTQESPRK
jgi:hypothetical protein